MSKKCIITGKINIYGNKRSHALNATRRKWGVNLQKNKININGQNKRIYISTKALKILRRKNIIL